LLGQQVLGAGITDVLGIVNIADIADVADIATYITDIATDIADIATDIADIVNITDIADHCGYCRLDVVNVAVTLPPLSVRLSLFPIEAIAHFITILSSSIDSLCDSCSAYLLPTVHSGNMPYIQTDPTPFQVVAGWQLAQAFFTILYFYLRRSRTLQ
jgi:hypothetical protein